MKHELQKVILSRRTHNHIQGRPDARGHPGHPRRRGAPPHRQPHARIHGPQGQEPVQAGRVGPEGYYCLLLSCILYVQHVYFEIIYVQNLFVSVNTVSLPEIS